MTGPAPFGYGTLTPYDQNNEYAIISYVCRGLISRLNTMKPVQVLAVHPGSGLAPPTVDVQPLVSQIDGNGYPIPHGTITGLPIFRLQAGPFAVILDPAVGDFGFVVAADRDMSTAKMAPGFVTPATPRQFDIADGIYVGGCFNAAPTSYLRFTSTGFTIFDGVNHNQIQSISTGVNIVTLGTLMVNGVPVTVP